jgi:hypothetical protein
LPRAAGIGAPARLAGTPVTTTERDLIHLLAIAGDAGLATPLALRPVPTRGLRLDGVLATEATDPRLREIIATHGLGFMGRSVMEYLVAYGRPDMTTAQLTGLVRDIADRVNRLMANARADIGFGPAADVARRIQEDEARLRRLASTYPEANVNEVPPIQAGAIDEFLQAHPRLVENLRQRRILFAHQEANAWGGGLYRNGIIHMGNMSDLPPDGFLRLFLHEVGHALFQQALLRGVAPEGDDQRLPPLWHRGEVIHLLARRRVLLFAQERNPSADRERELDVIQDRLRGFETVWASMTEDARTYYRAWLLLGRERGRWLLGLDLGNNNMRPDDRQDYQATTFIEFVAETFMQAATGELDTFLDGLLAADDVPADVKEAWLAINDVLNRLGRPLFRD